MISTDFVSEELNAFLKDVKLALLDEKILREYMTDSGRKYEDFTWLDTLRIDTCFQHNFFANLGAHGLIRWHYGIARRILPSIESSFIASHGRDWLDEVETARTAIIFGPGSAHELKQFDFHIITRIVAAFSAVCSTVGGAFILSCKKLL